MCAASLTCCLSHTLHIYRFDNQNYWKNSKWYYVNVERGNAADNSNGRKFNVSFTNTSNVPIEVMLFIFYSDEISIDVKTGLVTRHKN